MSVSIDGTTATYTGTSTDILTNATAQLAGSTNAIIVGYGSIGADAFKDATSLTSVTIPASVTNIGSNAFYSATTSLATVTFDDISNSQLTTIGARWVSQCDQV